jgi:hypothetical protein
MLVLDEFPLVSLLDRSGKIDASLFPSLARLAGEANWYRNTVAVGPFTDVAVPGILTGLTLSSGKLATSFRTQPQNLFNLLGRSHEIHASEAMTELCPPALCELRPGGVDWFVLASDLAVVQAHLLLPGSLRSGLFDIGERWKGFAPRWQPEREGDEAESPSPPSPARQVPGVFERGEEALESFERFRAGLAPPAVGERPPFHFMHLMLPHMPWRFLPSGRSYFITERVPPGLLVHENDRPWGSDGWLITQAQQRYLLQAAYTDRLVGDLLAHMKQLELYDPALIVVVADHGGAFVAGESRRVLGPRNQAEVLFVPLFVKLPGQRAGRVVDTPASTLDILPTVASVLGVSVPWPVEGRSLLHGDAPRASFPQLSGGRAALSGPAFDSLLALRDRRVADKLRVFGAWRGVAGLYRIGPRRALIGRQVDEFSRTQGEAGGQDPTHDWVAWIEHADRFVDLDPSAAMLPVLIEGRLAGRGANQPGVELAVSLGGRIEAVTRTYGQKGLFAAMLPEWALVRGPNRLAVHRIAGRRGAVRLVALRVFDPSRANRAK